MALNDFVQVSLDLATSVSVISAALVFIIEKKRTAEKERRSQEAKELGRVLSDARNTVRNATQSFKNDAMKLIEVCDNSSVSLEDVRESVEKTISNIVFQRSIVVDEVKTEYGAILSLIQDSETKKRMFTELNNALEKFKVSLDVGSVWTHNFKNAMYGTLQRNDRENFKMVAGAFVAYLCKSSPMKVKDIHEANEKTWKNQHIALEPETLVYLEKQASDSLIECGICASLNAFARDITKCAFE